ncbi:putative ORFan [Tupanvirus deep ocean]|uniref:ORFan n=1 Tax=Tupanvirus soda lake TaxID=2126985 RepID=A0A2K9L2S5_9VIRU|nr:putative ORFan [Tupanvirus deep ocean]AUL79282.2 putative ORFan [Tupanvirus deep ocean]
MQNPENIDITNSSSPGTNNNQNAPAPHKHMLGFRQSIQSQPIVYIMWLLVIATTMVIYWLIIGFRSRFTIVLAIFMLMILVMNMIFSGMDDIDSYEEEVSLYEYVEANARAFLPFGIALAALVIATGKQKEVLSNKEFLGPLLLGTACFVVVLTIIWMPKGSGLPIRLLRDIKTAVLTLGGVTVVALVGEFVFSHMQQAT